MKILLILFFCLFSINLFSQCDSTLIAKEGTYIVRSIEEAMDYINPSPRKLTCDELIYIEEIRSNKKIIIKLDDYTEVTIYPKTNYIQHEK